MTTRAGRTRRRRPGVGSHLSGDQLSGDQLSGDHLSGDQRPRGARFSSSPAAPRGARRRPAHKAPRKGLGPKGRVRAFGLLMVMVLAFAAIAGRLAYVQGVAAGHYLSLAGGEWERSIVLPAERGSILARNGDELAMSVPRQTIYADPRQVSDPRAEAAALAPILGQSQAALESKLSEPSGFVYLARTVSNSVATRVAKLDLAGVASYEQSKPYYPAGQLAAPLLGVVGADGAGLSGLEYKYNSLLEGTPGKLVEEVDPQGQLIPGGIQQYKAPVPGQDLVLTIDEPLQYDAEQALARAIVAAHAKGGIAMVMDTKTGQLLADAQLVMPPPGSNEPPAVPVRIPAPPGTPAPAGGQPQPVEAPQATSFTNVYEPGSVQKLITISGALESGVIMPSDTFTIPNTYYVDGTAFHDAESHPTEHLNVTQILAYSSNVGALQIAERLGKTRLLHYVSAYGEGKLTDIGFPGESAGLLPRYWSGTSLADMAFGQDIAVTAIQMLTVYNTVANGGVYVAPRLVLATIGPKGKEHLLGSPPPHRVISPLVDREVTSMLEAVAKVGTGTAAQVPPYTVAGKTGTANIPSPTGGYLVGRYVASFAGFAPAEDPQITAMVVIDNTPDYGAQASAPTFATIVRDALEEMRIPPHQHMAPPAGVPLSVSDQVPGAPVDTSPLPGLSSPATVPRYGTSATTAGPLPGAGADTTTTQSTSTATPSTASATQRSGKSGAARPGAGP